MAVQPVDVMEKVHELFLERDIDGIAGLLAEDAVIEFPFSPPGIPEHRAESSVGSPTVGA